MKTKPLSQKPATEGHLFYMGLAIEKLKAAVKDIEKKLKEMEKNGNSN